MVFSGNLSLGREPHGLSATFVGESPRTILQPQLPRPPRDLEWLHIPKTGTSFGNTLVLWACPELDPSKLWVLREGASQVPASCLARFRPNARNRAVWPIGDHHCLENRTDEELGRVVTMLRRPSKALASLFHFIRQDFEVDPRHVNATHEEICAWLPTSLWWLKLGHGLATKYVAGVPQVLWAETGLYVFPDASPPSQAMVREACRRLELLAFVGITDYWDASVCLFHAQHGGAMHPVELKNVREGEHKAHPGSVREVDCGDTTDDLLYQCGMWLFKQRLGVFSQCMEHLPPSGRAALAQLPDRKERCTCS